MESHEIDQIFNDTFKNLTFFYRDTDLQEYLISKYHIGQIIRNPAFTDMTYLESGLVKNLRYIIASTKGVDLSAFQDDSTIRGHCLLQPNALFKVLDIINVGKQVLILLLNIPNGTADFFNEITSTTEEEIIAAVKRNYIEMLKFPVNKELQSAEWIFRNEFPLGMDTYGEIFKI